MSVGPVRVMPLDSSRHDVAGFSCGRPVLDRWLRAYAGQSERRDVARTFVAADDQHRVLGYYTLVAGQVEHGDASPAVRARVSKHFPIPICLIARLAVAVSQQGQGLGTDLMRDAMQRIVSASEHVGMRAVLVHAVDADAARFYEQRGFEAATPDGLTLMVPVASARRQLGLGE